MSRSEPARARSAVRGVAPLLAVAALAAAAAGVQARQPAAWSLAVLEVGINSAQADGCPIESPKGLDLYFASTRPGAIGGDGDPNDIWRVHRTSIEAPWGTPEHLPAPVNSASADFCPTPLGGTNLYFVSARAGFCGAGDIFRTRENPVTGWDDPENLGCQATGSGPNFAGGEFSPSLVESAEGTLLFFSSTGLDGLDQDIYVSVMNPDGSFGPATMVEELSTAGIDQMPNVSRDGLEMVFVSDRTGGLGATDIWVTTRAGMSDPWGEPVNLGANVNTAAGESRPSLSGDGRRLHFGRLGDIWVSTRDVGNAHD
jgi:WD40-like Beta Propeller Repeat